MIPFNHGEIGQVGKFGIVGILNTLIDFTIFNILTSKRFKINRVTANICSTSVAMTFSFFANRQAVFESGTRNPFIQVVLFFGVTAFGLYVIQTGVLYLLADRWRWPSELSRKILMVTRLNHLISPSFALNNGAKLVGTLCSLSWSFFMYKYVVFR
ncbi:MAG TPA: GtrA family protein [Candidatus Polarisedimenticolaceae bacterium]|nr:GtrA family protein [Candidatus Polarisedimenticolaceae bacterium]